MKKLFICIMILVAVGLSFVGSVSGADIDLRAPAHYFPEGTLVYVGVRIDSETIATLDTLLAKVVNRFAEAGMPQGNTMTLAQGLNMASMMLTQQSFTNGIRPWLGDWAAFGLINVDALLTQDMMNNPQIPAAAILHITDRAQAAAFLDTLLKNPQFSQQNYAQQTVGQYTVFQSEQPDVPLLMLGNDVLIITNQQARPFFENAPERTLYDSTAFTETLTLLPEDHYHILGYFDLADYFKAMFSMFGSVFEELNQAQTESGETATLSFGSMEDYLPDGITMDDVYKILGQQAVGLTVLENRVLLVDAVQNAGDTQRLEELGLVTAPNATLLNPAFLAYIPADVDVLYQGTNAKYEYDIMLEQMNKTEDWEREFYKQYSGWFNFANLANFDLQTSREQMETLIGEIDGKLQPVTGLSLEADIISWLTGDYVFFAAYAVPEPGTPSFLTSIFYPDVPVTADVEFGLIAQATDPSKAQRVAAALAFAITPITELNGLNITSITIGNTEAVLVTIPPQDFIAAPLEVVIAANQDIFVLATRAAATAILTGQNSIQTNPHFSGAQSYVLPNATKIGYIGEDGINLTLDAFLGISLPRLRQSMTTLAASLGDSPATEYPQEDALSGMAEDLLPQQTTARMVAALVSSGTISETVLPDDDRVTRFALVLIE